LADRPTASPPYFPYKHRTMAEIMAIEAGMERGRQVRLKRNAYLKEWRRRERAAGAGDAG
jgi:hypothetical protein